MNMTSNKPLLYKKTDNTKQALPVIYFFII